MHSTRSKKKVSASQAILQGLAKDGGLFILDDMDSTLFERLHVGMSYPDVATIVFSHILDDYSENQIASIIEKAYCSGLFQPDIIETKTIDNVTYLELYHGPTFAFKDLALSVLPHLFDTAKHIQQIEQPTVILTATSGDTGSAALAGFTQLDHTHVIVLYPNDGVSPFQEQQMNAYQSDKATILAVDGNFDDCQKIAKTIFRTLHPEGVLLSSANSINIGRIIPQIVYYLYTHLSLQEQGIITKEEPVNITVPTGNFGNIYAAFLAKQLGLPVKQLLIASNQNNVLTETFQTARYQINRQLVPSISPSMDIVVSSNLERYLYYLSNGDVKQMQMWMSSLEETGLIDVPQLKEESLFIADFATEEQTKQEIKHVFDTTGYLIDPHTAVASYVHRQYQEQTADQTHTIVASTASPYKFVEAMLSALERPIEKSVSKQMQELEQTTSIAMDARIHQVLQQSKEPIQVTKQQAISIIKKVVGEMS
jgi:threonine synthase